MKGLEWPTAFATVESKFNLTRCIRQGSVEAPTLWPKVAQQILWNVEKELKRKWMESRLTTVKVGEIKYAICVGRQLLDYVSLTNALGADDKKS